MTARTRFRDNLLRLLFVAPASAAGGGGSWCDKEGREHRKAPFLAVNQRSTGVKPVVAERNRSYVKPLMVSCVKHDRFAQASPTPFRQAAAVERMRWVNQSVSVIRPLNARVMPWQIQALSPRTLRAAVEVTIDWLSTDHAADLASLMTLTFQRFKNVSLLAA